MERNKGRGGRIGRREGRVARWQAIDVPIDGLTD